MEKGVSKRELEKIFKSGPNMTREEFNRINASLTPQQRFNLNMMMQQLKEGKLQCSAVNVDEKGNIRNIVLDPVEKPSKPDKPFYLHFKPETPEEKPQPEAKAEIPE